MKNNYTCSKIFSFLVLFSFSVIMQSQINYFDGNQNTGFGGFLGESGLEIDFQDSSMTETFFILSPGGGAFATNNKVVIYIDSDESGNFTDTFSFTDTGDPLRIAISGFNGSGGSGLIFPPGFEADYAIGIESTAGGFAGLWSLTNGGSHGFLQNLSLFFDGSEYYFELTNSNIGDPNSFKFFATFVSDDAFRSDESIGEIGAYSGNPGYTGVQFDTYWTTDALVGGYVSTNSSGPGIWSIDNSWGLGNVPFETDFVTINTDMIVDTDVTTGFLSINSPHTVTVNPGNSLTVSEDLNNSGTVTVNSGSSLIVGGTSSGNITYNRNLGTSNWYLISSPVVGQDVDDFVTASGLEVGTPAINLGLGTYNTIDDTWSYYQNGTSNADIFNPGQGYVVNLSGASGDIAFTGTLLTTDLTPISLTTTGNGFNLAGNPYPSYLDSNAMLIGSSAALDSQTLWIWDQSSNGGLGSYITKVSTDNFKIAPGQGFFVQSDGAAGTLAINESFQSHESSDSFLRNELRPEIHLNLTNGTNEMMTKLYFINGTTTGFDNGYDGPMFGGVSNPFAIYTQEVANATGRNLAIQSLPDSDYESLVVPIGVNANGNETITFTANSQNLPDNLNVYLEDNVANNWTLLNTGDYVFTPSVDLSGTGRFFVHFTTGTLSAEDTVLNGLQIFADNTNRQILINGQLDHNSNALVYDMQGRIVLNHELNSNTVNNSIETNTLNAGLYVVEIKNDTQKRVQKIIIN